MRYAYVERAINTFTRAARQSSCPASGVITSPPCATYSTGEPARPYRREEAGSTDEDEERLARPIDETSAPKDRLAALTLATGFSETHRVLKQKCAESARRAEGQLVVMPGTACLSTKTAGRILRECNLTNKATVPSSSAMPGLSLRSP